MTSKITAVLSFLVFLSIPFVVNAQEVTEAHKDSLNGVVQQYYELNVKVFQADSTVEDIDNIFALFTADFTYVHPKYGGTYTRQDLYEGYIRNQKNGGYDGTVADIEIVNKIIGLNAVVTQKKFIEKKNGKLEKGKAQMTLFEFRNGKISRIFEYW
ncbi:nuclear transport factor 2 family protein [Flagellimonas sp. DF-77]|uniref:nuclear transport factor 2 family protein n=1 Tax=Flagellimonas algarum TaxID=3230298 RepID=UPI0033979A32